jgi:hypothetical protein
VGEIVECGFPVVGEVQVCGAAKVSVSWSGLLAPRITEVMAGLARIHAMDRVASDTPSSDAISVNGPMVSNALECQ